MIYQHICRYNSLNYRTVPFLTIQFNISQSDSNDGVFHIPQSLLITETSLSDIVNIFDEIGYTYPPLYVFPYFFLIILFNITYLFKYSEVVTSIAF